MNCLRAVAPRRPKVEPIRNPTLFEMEKLKEAGKLTNSLRVERPYSEPGMYLGISAFTAAGLCWHLHTRLRRASFGQSYGVLPGATALGIHGFNELSAK